MTSRIHIVLVLAFLLAACSDASTGLEGNEDLPGQDVSVGTADGTADLSESTPDASDAAGPLANDTFTPPGDTGPVDTSDPGPGKTGPFIAVVPESHSFSYISPLPAPLFKQVTIHNLGAEPLSLASIGFLAGSSVDFDIVLLPPMPKVVAPNKSTMVNVRFRELDGGDGTLRITSNDPDSPVIDVQLTSHAKATINVPEPCVGLTPNQLNFGTVVRGETKTLSAVLSNCAETESLTLKKIKKVGSLFFPMTEEFQMTPEPQTPQTLAPGQSLQVNVTYAPKLAGFDSGTYEFHTDDPGEPIAHLDVAAVGVQPPMEEIGLQIKVDWDTDDCDVDSHLIMPGGDFFDCDSDCHFGNPSPDWFVQGDWLDDPFLDVDDVDGYGPENINISAPAPGKYRFFIHYYSDAFNDSWGSDTNTTVKVLSYGNVIAEFGPTNLDTTNRTWEVFELEWISKTVPPIITPLGSTYIASGSVLNSCWPGFP